MNSIIVPNSYINYSIEEFDSLISECEPNFRLNKGNIETILDDIMLRNDKKDFDIISNALLFLIYNMVKTDDIIEPLHHSFKGRPESSFCFMNKKNSQSKGVYHAHISDIDRGVLIWYVTYGKNGYMVNFEYCAPHPYTSGYNEIIDRIFKMNNSFNVETFELLSDTPSLLIDSVIYYGDFIKLLK